MMESTLHDKLRDITSDLSYFLPEFVLTGAILLIVVIGLIPGGRRTFWCRTVGIIALIIAMVLDGQQWMNLSSNPQLFGGMLILDKAAIFWKFVFEIAAVLTLVMGFRTKDAANTSSEYYALILTVVFGAHLLAMANNLLMIFLGIEVISITSYILTSFNFNKSGSEAAIKYLLFGAAASAVMIYGMSWLYAFTGSLSFTDLDFSRKLMEVDHLPLTIGGIFVVGGIFFKIAAAPMHIWAPDVYSAAPTPVVAFFSVVPKLAGFAILIKWMLIINLFGQGPVNWTVMMAIVAIITITVGNFSALWQQNTKRMLAYSSVAHSGFLLVGIVAFSQFAIQSILFYAAVFLIMNMAAFILIDAIEKRYGLKNINEYGGFYKTSALTTVLMVIIMISLAGLPPTAGFTAKLLIFTALWESFSVSGNSWMLYLMMFGLINTVISLFYYLKIPYYMIFKERHAATENKENFYRIENFLGFVMVVALLLIFFKPDMLMRLINNVKFAF